jgi:cbb3-type cytochrome oxidase cytochrome c subunit
MGRATRLLVCAAAILATVACARRGKEVFLQAGCTGCHRFRGLGGGDVVDLSDVGSRHDAAWIRTQIVDPASHNPASRMPPFPQITGFDLRSLVVFLRR